MAIELLNNAYSTCSQKVRLCLHEKSIAFTDTQINFRRKEHLTPAYLKLNPNGVVPTLVHDGLPVTDSSVIMEYLDEAFPDTPLSPPDAYGRARMRAWLRFIEEVPTTAIRMPSFNRVFTRHYRDLTDEELQANADDRPLRRHFYQKMGREGFDDDAMRESLERLGNTIARMDTALRDAEWLCGEQLTLADYCVVPTFDRLIDLGLADLMNEALNVNRWWAAISARPAYTLTYFKGARLSDVYDDLKQPA